MAFDFLQNLVVSVLLLVLDIKHWIDEMLLLEQAETILPSEASEKRAVVKCCLRVNVNFCGPPSLDSILELPPKSMEVARVVLRPECRKILHIQISGLL